MKSRPLTALLPESFEEQGKILLSTLASEFQRGLEVVYYSRPEEAMRLISGQNIDLVFLEVSGEGKEHSALMAVALVPAKPGRAGAGVGVFALVAGAEHSEWRASPGRSRRPPSPLPRP